MKSTRKRRRSVSKSRSESSRYSPSSERTEDKDLSRKVRKELEDEYSEEIQRLVDEREEFEKIADELSAEDRKEGRPRVHHRTKGLTSPRRKEIKRRWEEGRNVLESTKLEPKTRDVDVGKSLGISTIGRPTVRDVKRKEYVVSNANFVPKKLVSSPIENKSFVVLMKINLMKIHYKSS